MKPKFINFYMGFARQAAQLSHAVRKKVGAAIVSNDVVVYGYNGTPSGWDNVCEYKEYESSSIQEKCYPFEDQYGKYRLTTKPEVLHAERNALDKFAKGGMASSKGAVMFTTLAPCLECAKSIYSAGISELYYEEEYKTTDGLYFLRKCGIKLTKLEKEML